MIDRFKTIIDSFEDKGVLVVGDIMVDRYIWGNVSRISPEAPVPVVLEEKREDRPGGSLNVVNNLISLNAKPYVAGIVGNDNNADFVYEYLDNNRVESKGIIKTLKRPSTLKTRIIGNNQQMLRLDYEDPCEVDEEISHRLISYVKSIREKISGIIVSDYNKGLISRNLLQGIYAILGEDIFIAVDPNVASFNLYRNISLVTPNHHEAEEASGVKIFDYDSLCIAAENIMNKISPLLLLITLGENGMALFGRDVPFKHVPTVAKHVYDVTGAGDTVITVFTLAMLCGAAPEEAAVLSNIAAGYTVGEMGTTAISKEVLKSRIAPEYLSL
ncbi:MAG: bifunctional ADP-heptose synthase [Spirochaetota bacterium]|nr:bifunctional ADP-heptose synthase [Spirochaetota bacterium]